MTLSKTVDEADVFDVPPAPRSKLGKLARIAGGLILLGGAGAAGALYAQDAGYIDLGFLAELEDPNKPHLVPREDDGTGYVTTPDEEPADPRKFKASYYALEREFTSNLRGGEAFVQIGIGVSTYYDQRVFERLQLHEMAVRSAILMTLADQDPDELATSTGKLTLKRNLKTAVNQVLQTKEGFGGIDDVHFTSFVMQ